jgi:hypothetical protein
VRARPAFASESDPFSPRVDVRESGVCATAPVSPSPIDPRDRPTARPARQTARELAPLHELLYKFEVGDHLGALATAEALLDAHLVPTALRPFDPPEALDATASLLLTFVDGRTPLERVLDASEIPMLDALRALCDLVEWGVVALRS